MALETVTPPNGVFAHGRNRVALSLLGRGEVTELLDYGCGYGEFAIAAADELGLTVHACDIDAGLIDELRARAGESVDFFAVSESDAALALSDGQVSAVTCCDVLEHMPATVRLSVLRELRRVLAKDGMLIVTTPHKGLLSALDPENAKFHFPRMHKRLYVLAKGREKYERRYGGASFGNFSAGVQRHMHFSRRELAEMLTQCGFRVEQVRYFTLFHPLIRMLLWAAESSAGRVRGADRLSRLLWRAYVWDADLEPGRLAFVIAICARRSG
jgi:ubiquinone/menaquinone biosynthesis C-methylase UbiE